MPLRVARFSEKRNAMRFYHKPSVVRPGRLPETEKRIDAVRQLHFRHASKAVKFWLGPDTTFTSLMYRLGRCITREIVSYSSHERPQQNSKNRNSAACMCSTSLALACRSSAACILSSADHVARGSYGRTSLRRGSCDFNRNLRESIIVQRYGP